MKPQFIFLNAALLAGSTISLVEHDPYMAYNFAVEIGGVVLGGFSEVDGLSSEIDLESYEEGGLNNYTLVSPLERFCHLVIVVSNEIQNLSC